MSLWLLRGPSTVRGEVRHHRRVTMPKSGRYSSFPRHHNASEEIRDELRGREGALGGVRAEKNTIVIK